MTLYLISGVLAVFVVINMLLTFALVGRIRLIQETVAAGGAPRDPDLLAPGESIQPFEAITRTGDRLTEANLAVGATLIGFFTPNCKPCEESRSQLLGSPPRLPLIAFVESTGDDDDAAAIAASLSAIARVAYTLDNDSVRRAFRPTSYPTFVRVENGAVAASGHKLREVLG